VQQLEFCAARGIAVVHFSEVGLLGGLDPEHLRRLRGRADELGLDLEIGMRSICPGSSIFDPAPGTAVEQVARLLEAARLVRSPIVRCVVGRFVDRDGGGIEQRIAETVAVLKQVRPRVADAGVKIAVENHAGDLQARELKMLVEEAGTDLVGVCLDSGNALWALEDPRLALDTLAPYVLTSHIRDGAVWQTPGGAAVAWTRMGDGNIGISDVLDAFVRQCPGSPVSLEVIVPDEPRLFDYRAREFWTAYPEMRAADFAAFMVLVEQGSPVPRRRTPGITDAGAQIEDVEVSLAWTRARLAALAP
jgi:sugar phosphate isomerase/epimerase